MEGESYEALVPDTFDIAERADYGIQCMTNLADPEADYEMIGEVGKVVFPCGWIRDEDKVRLYYGAADTCIGLATADLPDLLAWLKQNNSLNASSV